MNPEKTPKKDEILANIAIMKVFFRQLHLSLPLDMFTVGDTAYMSSSCWTAHNG